MLEGFGLDYFPVYSDTSFIEVLPLAVCAVPRLLGFVVLCSLSVFLMDKNQHDDSMTFFYS